MHFSDVEYNWYEHDVNLISLYGHLNDGLIGKLDSTEFIMNNTFWVGVYPGMTDRMIDYMAKVIKEAVEK